MGRLRCPSKHSRLWLHPNTVRLARALLISLSDKLYLRLTQAKEAGASIVIDGKQVALGIPGGGKQADANKPVPGIPLGRGATPDEAANAVLL